MSIALRISAQNWATEGSEWYYCIPDPTLNSPFYDFEHFWVEKDTIVESENCILIKSNKDSSLIFLYKDNKVFLNLLDSFNLIYDFNAKIGDTVLFHIPARTKQSYTMDTLVVIKSILESLDSINVNNHYLKIYRFPLTPDENLSYLIWPSYYTYISRIGYDLEFFFNLNHPSLDPITDLRCYSDNDVDYIAEWWAEYGEPCDYEYRSHLDVVTPDNSLDISFFKNFSDDVFVIKFYSTTKYYQITITDLLGKIQLQKKIFEQFEFGSQFTPGIYIINIVDINLNKIILNSIIIKL